MASASGALTKQWAGHVKHLAHLAAQEQARRERRGLTGTKVRKHKRAGKKSR